MKKHLFTIKMQPWCSARQHRARARGTEGGRGGVHLPPGPPAPLPSACPRRGWWAVTWRWGMAACAGPAAPPGGQPASSRPATRTRRGQARAAPPAGRHRGTHLMLSPEAAHGLLLLCQGHLHPAGDAWWGSVGWPPPAPEPPMAPRAVAWLVGTSTPMRKGGAAVLPVSSPAEGTGPSGGAHSPPQATAQRTGLHMRQTRSGDPGVSLGKGEGPYPGLPSCGGWAGGWTGDQEGRREGSQVCGDPSLLPSWGLHPFCTALAPTKPGVLGPGATGEARPGPSHAEPPAAVAAGWRTSAAATVLPEAPGPARHPPPMHFL